MSQSTVAGILLILFGIITGGNPRKIWYVAERWKSKEANGPSAMFALITRILGGVFIVVGALLLLGIVE